MFPPDEPADAPPPASPRLPLPEMPSAAPPPSPRMLGFRRYERPPAPRWRTYALHAGLFVLTLLATAWAGAQLTGAGRAGIPLDLLSGQLWRLPAAERWDELRRGLLFAGPFLGVLTVHEFGHYFTARRNRVRATLPYYLPVPFGLGTFGAVIRIKERIFSRREFFDIGIAGPLAGLAVAVPLLAYGFLTLPDPVAYVQHLHPEFASLGADYARAYQGQQGLTLARPLLYRLLEWALADPARLPHPNELLHYPLLVAGVLSLFFTALNLLPVGQLDGGHVLYGLLGYRQAARLSGALFVGFVFYAGLGLFGPQTSRDVWLFGAPAYALYLWAVLRRVLPTARQALLLAAAVATAQVGVVWWWPGATGQPGWLFMGLLLSRLVGIYHPPAPNEAPLSTGRRVLGWLTVALFVLCFTDSPFRW